MLGRGRTRTHLDYVTTIPEADRPFAGFRVPQWAEVRDLARHAAAAFPWVRSVGWDIAVSEGGPVLVEGNERWSTSLIQMPAPHGLMTGGFKTLTTSSTNMRANEKYQTAGEINTVVSGIT